MVGSHLWTSSLCVFMSLSEFKKRSVVWSCLAVVTLVTGLGESLHQLAGIRHDCVCATPTSGNTGHACSDSVCPFLNAKSDRSEQDPAPTSPDCCSVCRLLAHLGSGFFYLPAEPNHSQFVSREAVPESHSFSAVTFFSHSPRGPPCVL